MIGKLPENVLEAVLETIPLEISVLDENDKVLGWNKHDTRTFKRPEAVIGRNVRDCHPKKSVHKVEQILEDFKQGNKDKARFWIEMHSDDGKQRVLIEYYALRDSDGNYVGCLEASQNITEIQALEEEKRLLD
ncbi:MAG: PAS domain S-box protein [Promethearchaeota archaeon]|nr:MAG: PAS domain S-box protein [Candidatus Lokiarchaeota archaeon]